MNISFTKISSIIAITFAPLSMDAWGQNFGGTNFGGGLSSAEETARVLIHDHKSGGGAINLAVKYGDEIIPDIKIESENFTKLNQRNSFWVAEILGSIDSDLARTTLSDLYSRNEMIPRLVGAIGLGMQDKLPDLLNQDSFLIQTVKKHIPPPNLKYTWIPIPGHTETQLAIIALGYSRDPKALVVLNALLKETPNDYQYHAYACEALARIREKESSTVLRACLIDPAFEALPDAYRVLLSLGDKEAVPLGIKRINEDLKGKNNGFLIEELELVTGKSFGFEKDKWLQWWQTEGESWVIPIKFLVKWDSQPKGH